MANIASCNSCGFTKESQQQSVVRSAMHLHFMSQHLDNGTGVNGNKSTCTICDYSADSLEVTRMMDHYLHEHVTHPAVEIR